jgi:phosphonate transport system ATP-binding protein
VQVLDLVKHYDGSLVIDHRSFQVRKGQFLALLGPSGAGKTTLLRCLGGLLAPDSGEVVFEGVRATGLTRQHRRRIAVVFQQFDLVGRLDALDNVLAGRLGHVPQWRGLLRQFSREDRLFGLECLDRVCLLDQAGQRADTLSGGQQQRVAIARALAQRPDLILADEPIASLDPHSGDAVLELLGELSRRDGLAVVCSLHQLEFARRWSDRIIGIRAGRMRVDIEAASFDDSMARLVYGESGPLAAQYRESQQ